MATYSPAEHSVRTIGRGLIRPECVLATATGDLFVSHKGHGVTRICPNGDQYVLASYKEIDGTPILPNGIALQADGSFLIANISDAGGIYRLEPGGKISPILTQLEGEPCPPVNFVTTDNCGRIWFSISSTTRPRHLAYRRDIKNGLVGFIENGEVRIVLRGLHYTNEIRPDTENGWLYVSETFGQIISRFSMRDFPHLGERQTFAAFPKGAFVDGIALDNEGGLLASCIVSNEVFHVASDGTQSILLSERDENWVAEVESALDADEMGRKHFDYTPAKTLRNVSSIAFIGPELTDIVCGCLLGSELISVPSPVSGRKPTHWNFEVPLWGDRTLF